MVVALLVGRELDGWMVALLVRERRLDGGAAGWERAGRLNGSTVGWERKGRLNSSAAGWTREGRLNGCARWLDDRVTALDGSAAGWFKKEKKVALLAGREWKRAGQLVGGREQDRCMVALLIGRELGGSMPVGR